MILLRIVPFICFSFVLLLFLVSFRRQRKADNVKVINKRVEELEEKEKKLDELKQAIQIQEKINQYEEEIQILDQQYKELLTKVQK